MKKDTNYIQDHIDRLDNISKLRLQFANDTRRELQELDDDTDHVKVLYKSKELTRCIYDYFSGEKVRDIVVKHKDHPVEGILALTEIKDSNIVHGIEASEAIDVFVKHLGLKKIR